MMKSDNISPPRVRRRSSLILTLLAALLFVVGCDSGEDFVVTDSTSVFSSGSGTAGTARLSATQGSPGEVLSFTLESDLNAQILGDDDPPIVVWDDGSDYHIHQLALVVGEEYQIQVPVFLTNAGVSEGTVTVTVMTDSGNFGGGTFSIKQLQDFGTPLGEATLAYLDFQLSSLDREEASLTELAGLTSTVDLSEQLATVAEERASIQAMRAGIQQLSDGAVTSLPLGQEENGSPIDFTSEDLKLLDNMILAFTLNLDSPAGAISDILGQTSEEDPIEQLRENLDEALKAPVEFLEKQAESLTGVATNIAIAGLGRLGGPAGFVAGALFGRTARNFVQRRIAQAASDLQTQKTREEVAAAHREQAESLSVLTGESPDVIFNRLQSDIDNVNTAQKFVDEYVGDSVLDELMSNLRDYGRSIRAEATAFGGSVLEGVENVIDGYISPEDASDLAEEGGLPVETVSEPDSGNTSGDSGSGSTGGGSGSSGGSGTICTGSGNEGGSCDNSR